MAIQSFTVVLDRPPSDVDFDRLFDTGLDDTTPEVVGGVGLLHVDREADALGHALVTVVQDLERAGFHATSLQGDDLVSIKTVAARAGRSYESVRLLAAGKRGPGGFPAPVSGDGWSLYSWAAVADWFREHYGAKLDVTGYARTLAAADYLLRARAILPGAQFDQLGGLVA